MKYHTSTEMAPAFNLALAATASPADLDRLGTLARGLSPQTVIFDPKADPELVEAIQFFARGQTAYGEWLKKLNPKDRAPRGKCGGFFATHKRFRRSV